MGTTITSDFNPVRKTGHIVTDFKPIGGPISTVTGKPIPTAEQKAAEGINFIKSAGPIIGDIALTAAVPQLAIAKKASLLGKLGLKGLNTLFRAGAAGAGSAGGAVATDAIFGELNTDRAKKEALMGGGGELAISSLVGGAKKASKILKPLFEMVPNLTFSGTAVKNHYNKQFKEAATNRAENFLLDVAPEAVKKQAVKETSLSVMVNRAYAENGGAYELYKTAINDASEREGGVILVDDLNLAINEMFQRARAELPEGTKLQIMNEALGQFNYTPNLRKMLAKFEESDSATPREIEYLFANIFQNKGWNKLNPAQQEAREKLKEVFLADMDKLTAQNVGGLKRAADEEFKALAKFNTLRRIYNKAIVTTNADTGAKSLHPDRLYEEIIANEKRIKSNPGLAEIWPQLEAEAIAAKKSAELIQTTRTDVGPGSIFSRGLGGAAGGFAFGPPGVVGAETLGAASAWALMSPAEKLIIKQIFNASKDVARSATKAGIHMAGEKLELGKSH